jgi:hypothetical protein
MSKINTYAHQALTSVTKKKVFNINTRAAFMEVLTKILQQGTEFDTLAENVLADRYDQVKFTFHHAVGPLS